MLEALPPLLHFARLLGESKATAEIESIMEGPAPHQQAKQAGKGRVGAWNIHCN
jgi:hypothetical protein